jgi:hypothetical protein
VYPLRRKQNRVWSSFPLLPVLLWDEVAVYEHDEVPDHREEEPGDEEGGGEVEEDPAPAQVDHRCKKVFEISEKKTNKKILKLHTSFTLKSHSCIFRSTAIQISRTIPTCTLMTKKIREKYMLCLFQGMAGLCRDTFKLGVPLYPVPNRNSLPNVCKLISHSFSTVHILLVLLTLGETTSIRPSSTTDDLSQD